MTLDILKPVEPLILHFKDCKIAKTLNSPCNILTINIMIRRPFHTKEVPSQIHGRSVKSQELFKHRSEKHLDLPKRLNKITDTITGFYKCNAAVNGSCSENFMTQCHLLHHHPTYLAFLHFFVHVFNEAGLVYV